MNGFNSIAHIYDRLSDLVFGKSMRQAQTLYLSAIAPGAKVLILGGGTGWLLANLLDINPTCHVWYIDSSLTMIELAKRKIKRSTDRVTFIHGTQNLIPTDITFDAVITHFYLDLFPTGIGKKVTRRIRSSIHAKSVWLASDFIQTTRWHGVMLAVMYRFFRIACGIEATKLPEWKNLIEETGFSESRSQVFFKSFISSSLFQKNEILKKN